MLVSSRQIVLHAEGPRPDAVEKKVEKKKMPPTSGAFRGMFVFIVLSTDSVASIRGLKACGIKDLLELLLEYRSRILGGPVKMLTSARTF